MNLKELIAKLLAERDALVAKSATPDGLTEDEVTRATEVAAEYARLKGLLDAQEAATKALGAIPRVEVSEPDQPGKASRAKTLGGQFVQSEAYQTFKSAHPGGISDGTPVNIRMKADTVNREVAGVEGVAPEWTDDLTYRPPRTLLDLVTRGTTDKSYLPYRQLVSVTNNAALVGEAKTNDGTTAAAGLKPISELEFAPAEAKVADYADGIEVTNQELEDDGAIAAIINSTLTANIEDKTEDILLNGTGVGLEPIGLFHLTGVQNVAYATDVVTTVRKAFTALRGVGTNIQALLLNPEDNEAWDLLKDADGRYLGGGPFGVSPGTAWAVPRIECAAVPVGQAVAGDFSTIHLLDRNALEILVFNQHKDYAQRNLNYVRAEQRKMQLFRAPGKLAIIDLTAA